MTFENNDTLLGIFGILIILVGLLVPLAMWLTLVKKGDERRKIILLETCSFCFVVEMLNHCVEILRSFLAGITGNEAFLKEYIQLATPMSRLSTATLLFLIVFFLVKKKHGG